MKELKKERNGGVEASPPALTPLTRAAVYHGRSVLSGRSRIKIDGVPTFGQGQMFAVAASGKWEQWPNESRTESNTSCWPVDSVEIVDCVHHETSRPMRFVGRLEANHTAGLPIGTGSVIGRAAKADDAFNAELAHHTRLRNQGVDPSLKLPFIKVYTGKSHSTIYREIARGKFPPPIRHGKSVSWLMSHIDAYRLGTWMSPASTCAIEPAPAKAEHASSKPRDAHNYANVGSHVRIASRH